MLKFLQIGTVICAVLAGGMLYGQSGSGDGTTTADVDTPPEDVAKLTPAAMKLKANELIAEMQTFLGETVKAQQIARKQKDVIKLNCVNEKLLEIKQLLNIAEEARTELVAAIAEGNRESQFHIIYPWPPFL